VVIMIFVLSGMGNDMRIIFAILLVLFSSSAYASTTISAQVIRNQSGSGETFISSGFPFPPGLVTEAMITGGLIKVIVNGSEVAANVTGLRGRHSDGTLRSALIQFTVPSMAQNDVISTNTSVIVDGGARANADPTYVRPTYTILTNNNVILATSSTYLSSTMVTFQKLLPVGSGSAAEEKQYTDLAEYGFDTLVANPQLGSANYEEVRGMVNLWARTGDAKYLKHASTFVLDWMPYNTPGPFGPGGTRPCYADVYVNPDNRTNAGATDCAWDVSEAYFSRTLSYASMYLLTGYRDFWSMVDYMAQAEQDTITSESAAIAAIPWTGSYDYPRTSYAQYYGAMLPAFYIDATMPMQGNYISATDYNWSNQLEWTLTALKNNEWNIKWIPYNSGTGNVPAAGATITQGGASATLMTVGATMNDNMLAAGTAMPTSGYIMVNSSSVTGTFAAGALTGIGATATGTAVADTRNGMVGVRPNSVRAASPGIPYFQLIFPLNFLIDYYLNVSADSRIPAMVKANIDIYLNGIKPLVPGDHNYGETSSTWGDYYWGHGYPVENPVDTDIASAWSLAEFPRILAFVIKTSGNATVNGADYTTWYSRLVDTAGNHDLAGTQWKLFGQFYGFGSDAPWIMAQSSLTAPTYRTPTKYSYPPDWNGAPPDLARTGGGGGTKWKLKSITDDE
jgi:hypothetical protein